jgi:hypothetical protein
MANALVSNIDLIETFLEGVSCAVPLYQAQPAYLSVA